MLPFFPSAYADETVENRCARFATLQGHSVATMRLFTNRHYIPAPDLPYGLATLLAHLPPFHTETVHSICQQATLLPFYVPFLPSERVVWLQEEMASDDGSRIHAGSGLMASVVPYPEFLRYCPICVAENRHTVGQAYWHRAHQTAISLICHQHGIPLLNSSIRYHQRLQRHQLITLEAALRELHNPIPIHKWEISSHEIMYALAKDVFWLLQQPIGSLTPNHWYTRYWSLLIQHGYATYTKRIRAQKLLTAFLDKYPASFLDIFSIPLDSDSSDNWLLRLLRRPDRFHHPLLHLLLIHFLNHNAASITLYEPITTYFGDGAWPCLNTVCRAYKESVIDDYVLDFTHQGYPAATFTCPICGLVYRRIGPDTQADDLFSFTNYVAFGAVWESELRSKWGDDTFSLRALSRHLGVTTRTVNRHAQRLGLTWPRPHHRHGQVPIPLVGEKTAVIPDQIRQQKREQWLSVCQQHPDWGVKKLQQGNGGLFTWLRRHDLVWLKAHQPTKSIPAQSTPRVDWNLRDIAFAVACIQAALSLVVLPERPRRLSRTAILRHTSGQGQYAHHAIQLPISSDILGRLEESRVSAALRRISWVTEQCVEEKRPLIRWQLIRRTGVDRLKTEPLIHEALTVALHTLTKESLSTATTTQVLPTLLHSLTQIGELKC